MISHFIDDKLKESLEGAMFGQRNVSTVHSFEVGILLEVALAEVGKVNDPCGWADGGEVVADIIVLIGGFLIEEEIRKWEDGFLWALKLRSTLLSPLFEALSEFFLDLGALTWFFGFWYWSR